MNRNHVWLGIAAVLAMTCGSNTMGELLIDAGEALVSDASAAEPTLLEGPCDVTETIGPNTFYYADFSRVTQVSPPERITAVTCDPVDPVTGTFEFDCRTTDVRFSTTKVRASCGVQGYRFSRAAVWID